MPWDEIPQSSKEDRSSFLRENKKRARFLVDESVDPALADMLRQSGWNATHVREVGLLGHPDENVLAYAQREDLILLTHDPDFLDDRKFPPHRNPGVIVLPGAEGDRQAILEAVRDLLPVVGAFREIWRATKIAITHDRTWTVDTFDKDLGRRTRTKYRFRKHRRPEWWIEPEA